jgi:hypothetical protein
MHVHVTCRVSSSLCTPQLITHSPDLLASNPNGPVLGIDEEMKPRGDIPGDGRLKVSSDCGNPSEAQFHAILFCDDYLARTMFFVTIDFHDVLYLMWSSICNFPCSIVAPLTMLQ